MKNLHKLIMMLLLSALVTAAHADMKTEDLKAARALFANTGCANCHEMSQKSVGPALKEIAARYRGEKVAEDLAARIRDGSIGRWGKDDMHPPQGMLEPEEARLLANWVLNDAP